MKDIMKVFQSVVDTELLLKERNKAIVKNLNKKEVNFLLGTLCANPLESLLPGKGVNQTGDGVRKKGFLMMLYLLANMEI